MAAAIIDGKAVAKRVREEVATRVAAVNESGGSVGLATILVGEDPPSQIYVRSKIKACAAAGIESFDHKLPADTSEQALLALVDELNANDRVHGILCQLPVPDHIDAEKVLDRISPEKDVDGFHPENLGRLAQARPRFVSATPKGCMTLIAEAGCDPSGKHAVVLGRSNMVGRPMAMLLTNANATVTVCHSRTPDLAAEVDRADIVVAAIGRAELVKGAWIKPGAVVIDVGITRNAEGKLIGDVEYAAAAERASAITPVPGGVGPMTIASLLQNTVQAAGG